MVYIDLLEKDEPYQSGDDKITPKKETYQNNFEKVSYCISYKNKFSYSFWKWLFGLIPYNVYIRYKNSRTPFSYYVVEEKHIVKEVEVYSSNKHSGIPLIIGFKINESDDFRYYTFTSLATKGKSTGLPSSYGFDTNELEQRLKEENNRRNKIKFVTKSRQSQNYLAIEDKTSVPGFIRYEYRAKDDEQYHDHQVAKDQLFSKEQLDESTCIDKLLAGFNGCSYDFINVYYTETDNILALVEFEDDSNTRKHFERNDIDGFHWNQNSFIYHYGNVNSRLKAIRQQFEQRISYQLDMIQGNYTKNKISFMQTDQRSYNYTLYKHLLNNSSNIKHTEVLYYKKKITIAKNEKISRENDRIDKFDEIYTQIFLYVLNINKNEHLLIKAKTNDNKVYFLYRFDKSGNKWKQLDLEYLEQMGIINNDQLVARKKKLESDSLGKLLDEMLSDERKQEGIKKVLEDISTSINSIIVIADSTNFYGKSRIGAIIGEKGSEKEIPPIDINTNSISVDDASYTSECFKVEGYKVFMHNLLSAGQESESIASGSKLYIRLYSSNNKIMLYTNDGDHSRAEYLKYSNSSNELYIYFHDSRLSDPLLVFYNGQAYGRKDKDSKGTNWVKLTEITDCSGSGKNLIQRKLQEIKKSLSQKSTGSSDPRLSGGTGGSRSSSLGNQESGSNEESSHKSKDQMSQENKQPNGVKASANPGISSPLNTSVQNGRPAGVGASIPNVNGKSSTPSLPKSISPSGGSVNEVEEGLGTSQISGFPKPDQSNNLGPSKPGEVALGNGSGHLGDENINGNEGTPGSTDNAFIKFFKDLPELASEKPAIVYGTGSAIGAVTLGSIIGIGVLIYKKCFGVSAAVASVASESL